MNETDALEQQIRKGPPGEWIRWVLMLTLAALVSYFTGQNAANQRLTAIDVREQTRWEETSRRLQSVEANQLEMSSSQQRIETLFEQVVNDWARGVDRTTGEPLPLQRAREHRSRQER